jgi:beta-phosphoglucomutase
MLHPQAFIFDMNGTMINDMPFHIRAWHKIFHTLGAPFSLERTKEECYGSNHEIFDRIFPGRFTQAEKDTMSMAKEIEYQAAYKPHLQLINGLNQFLQQAQAQHIKMGIGSAAIRFNVSFVLDGLNIRRYFNSLVSADDVVNSKPNPETFLKAAVELNVHPKNCIVFEDAPKGVEAASRAGMKSVVLTTMHTRKEFNDPNILFFIEDYADAQLHQLLH